MGGVSQLMELKNSIRIHAVSSWQPEYNGVFYKFEDAVGFFYAERGKVRLQMQNAIHSSVIYQCAAGTTLPLPCNWILVEEGTTPLLFINDTTAVDISNKRICVNPPAIATNEYRRKIKPNGYYEHAPFHFNEYCISHQGQWGYICTKNSQELWRFSGYAYLYTDIFRWNNRLFFGTAGKGGFFYILNLENGSVLAQIKTGGTTSIAQQDNHCYVLSNAKKCMLLCIDLCDGIITQEVALPGKSSEHSRLQLIDDQLHAITFELDKGNGSLRNAVWNCISL